MSDPLTPEEIAELRRLASEATPGPWRAILPDEEDASVVLDDDGPGVAEIARMGQAGAEFYDHKNASLIVAARNALPRLLNEIERLRERERYFALLLGVPDGGQYRNDWASRIKALIQRATKAGAEIERLREQRDRYREALEAIAHPDDLVQANEGAFSVHAFRRVQEVAAAALNPESTPDV